MGADRKCFRNMIRILAKRAGLKPSKAVALEFDKHQVEKYGKPRRRINQAKGTHPRRKWKSRIADLGLAK